MEVTPESILGTAITWTDFERDLRSALVTEARLGPNKSVVDIGDGNGFVSCCGLVNCDWVGSAEEKLPKEVVIKIPSLLPLRRLNDSLPEGKKWFVGYTEEKWQQMAVKFFNVHNTEVAAYNFLEQFDGLAVPKKYHGELVKNGTAQLCLGHVENSRMMNSYEKHTVEQVRQVARALGKIQACSLKKEPTASELRQDVYGNMSHTGNVEAYREMFKSLLAIDDRDSTRELMEKLDSILPEYYGANIACTLHEQMGFRPVIVNGDLHTGNVLIDKDTGDLAALIDWQCAHIGVGVEDLHRIAISALTAEDRRSSMPMLVEEMYKSMVENLDGVEPPYSLEMLLLLSDILSRTAPFSTREKDPKITADEKADREKVKLEKIIGALEDVVQLDTKNKKHISNHKFKTTYRGSN